ncbi:ATP-dependent RNA helicase DBP2-like [Pyrus communis]|uniref:ATP-dependent RNA helicase DBP2-like n=1 Tax=Pyrus communis TaxID=23211 RepID=UPI0035BFFEA9
MARLWDFEYGKALRGPQFSPSSDKKHYGADAARGISYTASDVNKYRTKRRKITAKGPTSETQDLNTDVTSYTPQGSMPETQHLNTDDTSYTVEEYRQRRGMTVEGCGDIPKPIRTFDDTRFPENVTQQFSKAGFARPTPIQAQVWPMALEGRDLIGIAQPGSGKKLAYLMPAIVHINSQPKLSRGGDGPRVLILAPTERLGEEIQQEYAKFCAASNIKVLLSWKLSSPKKSSKCWWQTTFYRLLLLLCYCNGISCIRYYLLDILL